MAEGKKKPSAEWRTVVGCVDGGDLHLRANCDFCGHPGTQAVGGWRSTLTCELRHQLQCLSFQAVKLAIHTYVRIATAGSFAIFALFGCVETLVLGSFSSLVARGPGKGALEPIPASFTATRQTTGGLFGSRDMPCPVVLFIFVVRTDGKFLSILGSHQAMPKLDRWGRPSVRSRWTSWS